MRETMGIRMRLSSLAALAAVTAVAACTQTTYTSFEGSYNPYLRAKVFERDIKGSEAEKRRAMKFALGDLRKEQGVAYSPAFFESLGFTCGGPSCSLRVQKYIYKSNRVTVGYGNQIIPKPSEFGDIATIIVDDYVVNYTPDSVDVQVTSASEDYPSP